MGRRGKNEGFRLLTALVIAARGKAAEMGPACEAEKAGTLMLGRQQRERVGAEASSRLCPVGWSGRGWGRQAVV